MVIEHKQTDRPEFQKVDEGIAYGVIVDVEDHGDVEVTYNNETKTQHKLRLVFEVPAQETDDGRPRTIGKRCTASIAPSANLTKYAAALFGRELTEDESGRFDTDDLIGLKAKLLVVWKDIEGRSMHCIENMQPTDEDVEPSGNYVRLQDKEEKY